MTQPLGAVVVGTGFGCVTHLRALRNAGFEVRALVGRDPAKTADRAARFGVPEACTSLADALALPGTDAVTIATPPHTHAGLVLEAVAAGRHVICEKPFARDAAEAQQMLDAAEAAGVVHLLGTEFRWATGQALLTRALADGVIGEPRFALFLLDLPMLADPAGELPSWWQDAEQGGGWLGAHAAHVVDQVRTTLGEFDGVSAGLQNVVDRGMTAEDTYTVYFRLQSGVDGVLHSSAGVWGQPLFSTRISGTKGTAWVEGDAVFVGDASGTRKLDVPDDLKLPAPVPPPSELIVTAYDALHAWGIDLAPYTRLCETFRDLINGAPVPTDPRAATFADGVANMAVLDAIRRAATERSWVSVGAAT